MAILKNLNCTLHTTPNLIAFQWCKTIDRLKAILQYLFACRGFISILCNSKLDDSGQSWLWHGFWLLHNVLSLTLIPVNKNIMTLTPTPTQNAKIGVGSRLDSESRLGTAHLWCNLHSFYGPMCTMYVILWSIFNISHSVDVVHI